MTAKKAFRPWHTEKVRIQRSCLICLFFLNISFSSSLPFIFIHNLGFWNIFDFSEVDNLKTTSTFFSEWMPSFSKFYKSWFSFKTYLYLLVRYCTSANNWSVLLFFVVFLSFLPFLSFIILQNLKVGLININAIICLLFFLYLCTIFLAILFCSFYLCICVLFFFSCFLLVLGFFVVAKYRVCIIKRKATLDLFLQPLFWTSTSLGQGPVREH